MSYNAHVASWERDRVEVLRLLHEYAVLCERIDRREDKSALRESAKAVVAVRDGIRVDGMPEYVSPVDGVSAGCEIVSVARHRAYKV